MSLRSEPIKLLIEQSGKSYQDLEKYTGVKKSSLQRYASGTTAKIPLDVIEKLSNYFNVPQTYLMGWDEEENTPEEPKLNEGEKMLLELFRRVPAEKQELVLGMIRAALDSLKQ
jgi:transcriptional regulator with XRE-family HTH domain